MEQGKYNDKEIFISAYDEYADAIFRYCAFRVFDRERAREIMQEVFTKTWEYVLKGENIENMRAFLYKVAHNLCVNERMRSQPLSLEAMSEEYDFDPEDRVTRSPEHSAEVTLLMEKLQLLKPHERDILVMRYVEDLAVAEIAEILDTIPNTASVRIGRAEEALKELYENHE